MFNNNRGTLPVFQKLIWEVSLYYTLFVTDPNLKSPFEGGRFRRRRNQGDVMRYPISSWQ